MSFSKRFALFCSLIMMFFTSSAHAALKMGDNAPDFTTEASLGGKVFSFSLSEALKQGPVVLYFYPAAFTKGCTIEAHNFAEAMDDFEALGATVLGVSHDGIEKLNEFSVSECRGKFAVGSDADGKIMKSYDAVMTKMLNIANRTSYVITPNGKILYAFSAMSPDEHVSNLLNALKDWRVKNPK